MIDFPNSNQLKKYGTFKGCKFTGSYPTVRAICYELDGVDYTIFEVEDREVVSDNPYNLKFGDS